MIPQKFQLTPVETSSALWTRIKAHLEDRLSMLREKNDGNLDERQTARVRGRIDEVKSLLGAGESTDAAMIND